MLKLYDASGSSSLASHVALEEAGAHYETQLINEDAGEHKTEADPRINPRGKVPALRLADGSVLVENIAIQTYIARKSPRSGAAAPSCRGRSARAGIDGFFCHCGSPSLLALLGAQPLH